jgi:uncharacterized membrane protein
MTLPALENINENLYGFIFHYYRGEVYRETNWRNRLDTTTNWSIVVTAAISSFAFGNENAPHFLLIINYLFVLYFLYIESRRFRYYSMLRDRTRLLEKYLLSDIFASKVSSLTTDPSWRSLLEDSLKEPKVKMSRLESICWRLRRNYVFIILFVVIEWLAKVSIYPSQVTNFHSFISNAHLWSIPGEAVIFFFLFSVVTLFTFAFVVSEKSEYNDLP